MAEEQLTLFKNGKPALQILRPIKEPELLVINGEVYTHEIDTEAMKVLAWHSKNIPSNDN